MRSHTVFRGGRRGGAIKDNRLRARTTSATTVSGAAWLADHDGGRFLVREHR